MAGILRLSNTGTGNGQSTITTAATGDATYTLPSFGGTLLTSSGNVTLPFASGTVSTPSVTFISDLDTGLYSPGANQVAIATSGTARLTVDSSGRVGVGATTVDERLHIEGSTGQNTTIKVESTATAAERSAIEFFNGAISRGRVGGSNDFDGLTLDSSTTESAAVIRFRTGGGSLTERFRIGSNGVVTVKNGAVAEIGTLADGATITPDLAANCNFTVTISGNRTLANPSNITAGQTGSIFIIQGTGSNTLSWGSYWDFPGGSAPTLTTTSGAVDRVDYVVRSSTSIHTVFTANYS